MYFETINKRISSILHDIQRLSNTLHTIGGLDGSPFPSEYEALSVEAARRAEWIALRLRHLVYTLPHTRKWDYLPKAADTMGIKIEQREGMYEITLPGLMPKRKSSRGIEYLIDPLTAALEQHMKEHSVMRFPHYTVCFVMAYDRTLSERRIRDYDNLELKAVLDAAAAYLMESDSGLLCDAFHSTELGEVDCTQLFIMDSRQYPQWYAARQARLHATEKDA